MLRSTLGFEQGWITSLVCFIDFFIIDSSYSPWWAKIEDKFLLHYEMLVLSGLKLLRENSIHAFKKNLTFHLNRAVVLTF